VVEEFFNSYHLEPCLTMGMGAKQVLRRPVSGWAHAVAGLTISGIFGWLAIRDVSWDAVRASLAQIQPGWLGASLALLAVAVWMRAERWGLLFARDRRPGRRPVFWALMIGYLFNNLLPARAGEAARVVALRREAGVSVARGAATVAVERVFDLASLAVLMLVATPALGSSPLVRATAWASAVVLALAAVLVAAARNARLRRRISGWIVRVPLIRGPRALTTASELGAGVRALGDGRMALEVGVAVLAAERAEPFEQAALERGVHVLVGDRGPERPVRAGPVQVIESLEHGAELVVGQQPGPVQHPGMGPGGAQVVAR